MNNCINKFTDNKFYQRNPDKYNRCLTDNVVDMTKPYKHLCRCKNGMLGYTSTGNQMDCNCYGSTSPTFTFLDNYPADQIIKRVFIIRMIIVILILFPFVYHYNKYNIHTQYNIIPLLFGALFLYTIYLLKIYYY